MPRLNLAGSKCACRYEGRNPAREASVFAGVWSREGDELVQTSIGVMESAIAFGDVAWRDYSLNLDVKVDTTAPPGGGAIGVSVGFNVTDINAFRRIFLGAGPTNRRYSGHIMDGSGADHARHEGRA